MSRSPSIVEFVQDIELTDEEIRARISALTTAITRLRAENTTMREQAERKRQKVVDRMVQDILKSRQYQ
jgi:molecular chaperone GrpE (heat shock protein)